MLALFLHREHRKGTTLLFVELRAVLDLCISSCAQTGAGGGAAVSTLCTEL